MGVANLRVTSTAPPERFVEALTDFGPRRSEVFGNSEGGYLEVHDRGDTWAEVTEGSGVAGGVWQRTRYDWSQPGVVRLEAIDANAFGKGSSWEYRVTPEAGGGSAIALTIRRNPTTLKGRVLDVLLTLTRNRFVRKDLEKSVARLEGRGG